MLIHRSSNGQKGESMTEYIIIVALVAVAAIAVVSLFGGRIKTMFNKSAGALNAEKVTTTDEGADAVNFNEKVPGAAE